MSAVPARQFRPVAPTSTSPRTMPLSTPAPTAPRRDHLSAVAAPEHARSMVLFTWSCLSIVIAAFATVLILNTAMASGAYERRDLKIELADLHQQRAALVMDLEANSSPQHLAVNAQELGMVPAGTLGSVFLEDGVVLESDGD